MGRETYTQREDLFFPYLLPGAWGCQRLHPLSSRDTSDRLRVPRSTVILYSLSKSDRVVLIRWSPSGYSPVVPEYPDRAAVYYPECDSLPKHTGSLGTNRKSMAYVI